MKKKLPANQSVNYFELHTVLYLTGDVNYSHVHLLNGRTVLSSRTLKWFADQWPHFIRAHKQALVNPIYVYQVRLAPTLRSPSYLVMRDEVQLTISRRRVARVMELLEQADLAQS